MILKRLLLIPLILTLQISICMEKPTQRKSTWDAAKEGDLKIIQQIITEHPGWVDSRQKKKEGEGLTPLALAVINDHLPVVKFLVEKGANVNFRDESGQTILHMAARTGDIRLIEYLLKNGAKKDINAKSNKGRTPLAEVLRASKDSIIHLDIETKELDTQEKLRAELSSALDQLATKGAKKLSTNQMIPLIKLLREYGAITDQPDATGHTLDYYINESALVTEADRIDLLDALNVRSIPARPIIYNESNLPQAIELLEILAKSDEFKKYATNINNVIWTIQQAQKESNQTKKYNLLRIAMGIFSKVRELIKNTKEIPENLHKRIEPHLDKIRTILRDTALITSGKVAASTPTTSTLVQAPKQPAAPTPPPTSALPAKTASTTVPTTAYTPATKQEQLNALMLQAAEKQDWPSMLKYLGEGANINAQDVQGYTALMYASEWGQPVIVSALLDRGANPHLLSNHNGNALTMAGEAANGTIIRMLLKLNVNPNSSGDIGKRRALISIQREIEKAAEDKDQSRVDYLKKIEKLLLDAGAK